MASDNPKEQEFRVEDRRRFAPGREDRPGSESAAGEPGPQNRTEFRERPESTSLPELTFSGFVLGLSAQAMMFLGESPDPLGGRPVHDLSAARQLIDILGMLKDKTVGNLEEDENELLDHILFDLRTKYIEKTKKQ